MRSEADHETPRDISLEAQLKQVHKFLKREHLNHALDRFPLILSASRYVLKDDPGRFVSKAMPDSLWREVLMMNNLFRKRLSELKSSKPVELRKLRRKYLKFLIVTQDFLIELFCLLATCSCIDKRVRDIIRARRKLEARPGSVSDRDVPSDKSGRILTAIYESIVRLGDLSRYREQVREKEARMMHALEWHTLAIEIQPERGRAYYQRAMVYKDSSTLDYQLRAIYDLSCAAASKEKPVNEAKDAIYALLTMRAWHKTESDEEEDQTSSHALLQLDDPEWSQKLLEGTFFEVPFRKAGFVVSTNGVSAET